MISLFSMKVKSYEIMNEVWDAQLLGKMQNVKINSLINKDKTMIE